MNDNICTFFGHRILTERLDDKIYEVVCSVIENEKITTFYVGGYGDFDNKCVSTVRRAKQNYNIKLILIKPKMTQELNKNREYYKSLFDEVLIPESSDNAFFKSSITVRNRWMIENSKVVISYIRKDYGGAFDAIMYAKKLNKILIDL